jgi:asparagine synthase (glutamine-hydrolysing)
MCGIFFTTTNTYDNEKVHLLAARGPDAKKKIQYDGTTWFFFRLAIQDTSHLGMQPWETKDFIFMANGEIYNSPHLRTYFTASLFKSTSDCEVVPHVIKKFGIKTALSMIQGVFAFVYLDKKTKRFIVARDALGIKSLYVSASDHFVPSASGLPGSTADRRLGSHREQKNVTVSSELKAFNHGTGSPPVRQFPAGHFYDSTTRSLTQWHSLKWSPRAVYPLAQYFDTDIFQTLRCLLKKATLTRLETSDREVGCFLSGGLDSSIVAALAQKEAHRTGVRLKTFSVGMEGATDLIAARKVAQWIQSDHHEVVFSEKDMIQAIPKTIKRIESYDITTVRAATGMVLLSDYIAKNTQVKVVFSGEGADELSGSYRYFRNAPSPQDLQDESVRLVQDLQYFDILRCDKSVSGAGLEARTPFFDMNFVDWYMRINPSLKCSRGQIEKKIIRDAYAHSGLLPPEILQRGKEAFSDGCSTMNKPWFKIIQDHCDRTISNEEFEEQRKKFSWLPPQTKEAYWYRTIFETCYPGQAMAVPYMWLPKWTTQKDPSARLLS